ncbi:hypothetical protein [Streptomyces sp. NBC_01635]|uniref:hypothetical protein n=1 Tax=Streptomyces TaxID=1883 RepID=UPI003866E205
MLLPLAYLSVTNKFAMSRLLSMSDRDKGVEILALRHQITVLERQLGRERAWFTPTDRAFLAALLHRLLRDVPRRLRLPVQPDTVLHRHRDTGRASARRPVQAEAPGPATDRALHPRPRPAPGKGKSRLGI